MLRDTETDPRVIYREYRKPYFHDGLLEQGPRVIIVRPAHDAWRYAQEQATAERERQQLLADGYRFEWESDDINPYDCDHGSEKWKEEQRCPVCLALPSNFDPHYKGQSKPRYRCEHGTTCLVLYSPDGDHLDSLGGIESDVSGTDAAMFERDMASNYLYDQRERDAHERKQSALIARSMAL